MKRITVCVAVVFAAVLISASAPAKELSKGAEFFLYDDRQGNSGRTDFFVGGADGWGVDSRIDYLKNYAAFLKRYFGGIKLDEYATGPDEVERIIKNLKPQPQPKTRRVTQLSHWRWSLSDEGESLGWTARNFDDSAWETTAELPKTVKGAETRDLWARTTVRTGAYDKAFIDLEGVLGRSEMWVNGAKVVGPDAIHNNSAPFRVDLTTWLEKNAENVIVIHIRDHKQRGESGSKDEPSKYIGWGFVGRASLIETGPVLIDNVFVYTKQLTPESAKMDFQFTLKNFKSTNFEGSVEVTVRKWFPKESASTVATVKYPLDVIAGSGLDSPKYYALDFGTADSPVADGFDRVTSTTKYSKETGYGWEKKAELTDVDYPAVPNVEYIDADVKRDAVEGAGPASFKIATGAPGLWTIQFYIGSPEHPAGGVVKYIQDKVYSLDSLKYNTWEFAPLNVTQFVRGNSASLKFEPGENNKTFTINGLVAMNHVPWKQRYEKSFDIPKPEAWSPETPVLYEMRVVVKDENGNAVDDTAATFGVMKLENRDGEIYLNGKRYRIRGVLETHSFPPERDDDLICIAPPDKWIAQDIADNRKANVNMMRFHPAEALGTNYTRWLEFADQMGMFVIWAPREWLHWGKHAASSYRPILDAYLEPSMISARNHPSVFAWEGGNETYSNDGVWDERARGFADEYYDAANALDPSRFILPISFWYAQFDGKADFYKMDPIRGNELTWPGSGRSPRAFWAQNVFWDVHPYPGWYGSWAEIWWQAGKGDFYRKDRPFIVSEFGAEGMPNWELYRDEKYYHAWGDSQSNAAKYEKDRIGRNLEFDEWQASQAYQALVMYNSIAVFRTEDADGLSICTGAEGRHNGRYFKGLRDMHRRPKLSYYVTGMAYRPLFIEGLNGDTVLSGSDSLNLIAVNEGPARTVDIAAVFRDMSGKEVYRSSVKGVKLPAVGNLRNIGKIKPVGLKSGNYYSVEYVVTESAAAKPKK